MCAAVMMTILKCFWDIRDNFRLRELGELSHWSEEDNQGKEFGHEGEDRLKPETCMSVHRRRNSRVNRETKSERSRCSITLT